MVNIADLSQGATSWMSKLQKESHTLAKQRDVLLPKPISGDIRMKMRDEKSEGKGQQP